MAKYRIVKREYINYCEYEVQKKVWWFPFWFNWLNVDAYTTGCFRTMEEACEAIEIDKYKPVKTIINYD